MNPNHHDNALIFLSREFGWTSQTLPYVALDKETYSTTDRQTYRQTDGRTDGQMDGITAKQTDKQQIDTQASKQTRNN